MINDSYQSELITMAIVLHGTGAVVRLFITIGHQRSGKSSIVLKWQVTMETKSLLPYLITKHRK